MTIRISMIMRSHGPSSGGSPVSYNSQDLDESVDKLNVASFIYKEAIKLQAKAPRNYIKNRVYKCPCHLNKPKGGLLERLLQHVRELAQSSTDACEKAQHVALLEVLAQAGIA